MSHELRTPLNAVIGFSKRLLPSFTGNEQLLLDRIHKNGTQLLSIVNDLLDVSRIEVGEVTLAFTDVDLRPLVASVVEDIRGLVPGDVQIRSVLPGDGPLRLRADENRLRQILNNLMSNALKFTESGTVTVEVVTSLGGEVEHIAVSDTGIGISTSDLERVFLPFHQADNSHARPHDGTGLGLALCKSFAELMGFRMEATSNPGVGSTFRVVVR